MPAQLDPCPSYQKRTKLKQKGPDDCSVTYGTPRRLDTGYVVLHCLASLVGSRGREDGRKCHTSSDSLPEDTGKPVGDGFHPLCYRRITRCISKTQISCTSIQPLPTWLIWMPTRRSSDKAELFPYSYLAYGLKLSYCRKLTGKLLNLLP